MDVLKGRILEQATIKGTLTGTVQMAGGLKVPRVVYPPAYQGPVEVTPTEEAQVLETKEFYLENDITINAIDSDYVGSDIPRRTALIRNGATVTAQEGYYSEETDTTIPDATMKGVINPYPENVGGSVDDNGLVGINYEIDDFAYPIYQEGYATPSDGVLMYNSGTLEYQLSTQGATTITPTTSEQVAVAKGKFTTGVVKVAPIPNNYGLVTWNGSILTIS